MSWKEREHKAVQSVKELLGRPMAPDGYMIGVIDETTDEPMYFDPWDIFPLYGNYSSEFDNLAIRVLSDIHNGRFDNHSVADEMFREMLCNMDLCDYGTSPRACFANSGFKELLPEYIERWKEYYELVWDEPYQESEQQ